MANLCFKNLELMIHGKSVWIFEIYLGEEYFSVLAAMVMHYNGFYEKMIEVGQAWPSRYLRDFSTKITLIFILITIVYYHIPNGPYE